MAAGTRRDAIARLGAVGLCAATAACAPLSRGEPAPGGQVAAPARIILGHRSRPEYDPLVQEALAGTQPYVTVNLQFLCYQEMIAAFQPILDQVFRDGTQRPAYLRDVYQQVEQAAASCGATFR